MLNSALFTGFIHTFKCILNYFGLHVLFWALVAFYFSNITFQINLILSVFDCLFSVVFFEVIGFRWFSKKDRS